jgi:hypothetical protein
MRAIMCHEIFILQNGFSKNEIVFKYYWHLISMKCVECGSTNVQIMGNEIVCKSCYTVQEGVYAGQRMIV